jgi:hypothetical protein
MSAGASPPAVLDGRTGAVVSVEILDSIGIAEMNDWEKHWKPHMDRHIAGLEARDIPRSEWPQQRHWNWKGKANPEDLLLAQRGIAIRCAGMTEGLMLVQLVKESRIESQVGKPLVYVDYLEVAPWNQPLVVRPQRYRGIGTLLVGAAISLSLNEEFGGRLGLHALRQSESFYRDRCGMTDLGVDTNYQGLRYFEMTAERAVAFLRQGGQP